MKHILLAATLLATPALAQEAPQHEQAPAKLVLDCMPLAKFLKDNKAAGDTQTDLTPGQYHFMVGVYVGLPFTPDGLPPGDGATIVSKGEHVFVVWTRDKKLACNPMPVTAKLLVLMAKLKAGGDNADTL